MVQQDSLSGLILFFIYPWKFRRAVPTVGTGSAAPCLSLMLLLGDLLYSGSRWVTHSMLQPSHSFWRFQSLSKTAYTPHGSPLLSAVSIPQCLFSPAQCDGKLRRIRGNHIDDVMKLMMINYYQTLALCLTYCHSHYVNDIYCHKNLAREDQYRGLVG